MELATALGSRGFSFLPANKGRRMTLYRVFFNFCRTGGVAFNVNDGRDLAVKGLKMEVSSGRLSVAFSFGMYNLK